jgi:hypothetical protein
MQSGRPAPFVEHLCVDALLPGGALIDQRLDAGSHCGFEVDVIGISKTILLLSLAI